MSAPQTPSPCPSWCRIEHPPYTDERLAITHVGPTFVTAPTTGTNVVTIVGSWTKYSGERPPKIMVERPEGIGAAFLDADGARTMAAAIAAFNRRSPLAAALREAADELDRITSGGDS